MSDKNFKSYREESRTNWGTREEKLTLEQIKAGAILRIADATEKMAQRHTDLIRDRDAFQSGYNMEYERRRKLERSNAALRGAITRLKRALARAKGPT